MNLVVEVFGDRTNIRMTGDSSTLAPPQFSIGWETMLVQKGITKQLVWAVEDTEMFIQVIGEGVSREEILHVASELKY